MGKQIALLRHGEAEPGMGVDSDLKRKLSDSGIYKLERLAQVLKDRNVFFDLLLKSPAQRTLQTADIVGKAIKVGAEEVHNRFYLAECETLFKIINQLPENCQKVILVGHNPGISALLAYLTGEFQLSLSAGMMAVMDLESARWNEVSRNSGTLVEVLQ